MNIITKANAVSSQMVSLMLILVGATLAVVAYLHGNSDGVRGQMFTFAGGIVTDAFALLRGDSSRTQTTDTPQGETTKQTVETPQTPTA